MKKLFSFIAAIAGIVCMSFSSYATVGPINGVLVICNGTTTSLTDTTAGGTWSSSNTVANVGLTSGIVVGVSPGIDTVTYTVGGSSVTAVITVNPLPASIAGDLSICL